MRGKKILFVVHEFPPLGGGAGVWIRTLADLVLADGGKPEILTFGLAGTPPAPTPYPVHILTGGRRAAAEGETAPLIGFYLRARREIARLQAANRYDRLYAHFTVPDGLAALPTAAAARVPLVVDISGADIHDPVRYRYLRPLLDRLNRRVLGRAALVIAPSRDLAERVWQLTGARPEVVHRAADTDRFHPGAAAPGALARLGLPPDATTVITVCRLIPRKNLGFALAVMAEVMRADPAVRYLIVGEGPERAALAARAAALGIADRVVLAGRVPDDRLPGLVAASRLFLLTSHHEAFGIVLAEALAAGTPVVAPAAGGIVEIAEPGAAFARWVAPGDRAGFAAAVRDFLRVGGEPAHRAAARAHAVVRFSRAAVAATWRERMGRVRG